MEAVDAVDEMHLVYKRLREQLSAHDGALTPSHIRQAVHSQLGSNMVVFIPFTYMSKWPKLKTSVEVEQEGIGVDLCDLPFNAFVIFISHRWWHATTPDTPDGAKLELIQLEVLRVRARSNVKNQPVYIWMDVCCVSQDDLHGKGAKQINNIPLVLMCANACMAISHPDSDTFSIIEKLEQHGKHASSMSLPGRYENRVWTQFELFAFTSQLLSWSWAQIEGTTRKLFEYNLSEWEYQVGSEASTGTLPSTCTEPFLSDFGGSSMESFASTREPSCREDVRSRLSNYLPKERLQQYRNRFHSSQRWTLPPAENLAVKRDLEIIEPLMIALATEGRADDVRLHTAVRFGFKDMCQSLATPALVNLTDSNTGLTPLMVACLHDRVDMARLLLHANADPNVEDCHGFTAPFLIPRLDHALGLVRLVAHHGANLISVNSLGRTLLHHFAACRKSSRAPTGDVAMLIDTLIDAGVDPSAKDQHGRTAHMIANNASFREFVKHMRRVLSDAEVDAEMQASSSPCGSRIVSPAMDRRDSESFSRSRVECSYSSFASLELRSYGIATYSTAGNSSCSASLYETSDPPSAIDESSPVNMSSKDREVQRLLIAPHGVFGKESLDRLCRQLVIEHPNLEVIAMDPFGLGDSDLCMDGISFEAMTYDTAELVRKLGKCHLAGICVSAEVMMRVAMREPSLVLSLTLMSPPSVGADEKSREIHMDAAKHVATGWETWKNFLLSDGLISRDFIHDESCVDRLNEMLDQNCRLFQMQSPPGSNFAHYFELAAQPIQSVADYSNLCAPTLLLTGADDLHFMSQTVELSTQLPKAEVVWLPETGHFPQFENPEAVARQLIKFIRQHVNSLDSCNTPRRLRRLSATSSYAEDSSHFSFDEVSEAGSAWNWGCQSLIGDLPMPYCPTPVDTRFGDANFGTPLHTPGYDLMQGNAFSTSSRQRRGEHGMGEIEVFESAPPTPFALSSPGDSLDKRHCEHGQQGELPLTFSNVGVIERFAQRHGASTTPINKPQPYPFMRAAVDREHAARASATSRKLAAMGRRVKFVSENYLQAT